MIIPMRSDPRKTPMVRPFPPVRATPPIAHAEIAMVAYPLAAFGVADATLAVERIPAIAERPPEIIYVEKRTPFTLIPEINAA